MAVPNDRKYSQTHEWFKVEGDTVTVGITQFAADNLTDITYVDLPAAGDSVEGGSHFGEVESVKATGELFCPVSGEVIAVNEKLGDEPGLLNSDPFESGWMLKLKCSDLGPLEKMLDGVGYEKMIAE
jgi:glycine cleavage system H protein